MEDVEIMAKLTEVEQRGKSNTHQIEELKARQNNLDALVTSVATLATEQEHIKEDVTEIKGDVKTLTGKSAKRWDELVEKVIWTVVVAAVSYFIAKFGL